MRFKNVMLWCAVMWFAVAVMWIVIIALRLSLLPQLDWQYALQALVVALSAAAGVLSLRRWRSGRKETSSGENSR